MGAGQWLQIQYQANGSMHIHLRHQIDDQNTGNDQNHSYDGRQVRNLLECHRTDNRYQHYAHRSPDSVCDSYGDCSQRQT